MALCIFILQIATGAIQPMSVNEPQLVIEHTVKEAKSPDSPTGLFFADKFDQLGKRYNNNLKNCVPVHWHDYLDIFGFKLNLSIDINGWIDGKCEYKITGNIPSIGKDIREVFEVKATDEQIAAIKPMLECHFTKPQLEMFWNTMINSAGERTGAKSDSEKAISNMMDAPQKDVKKPQKELSPEEQKLAMMFMTENICTVPNKEDVMNKFNEIIGVPAEKQQ